MRKIVLLLLLSGIIAPASGQSWNASIEKASGRPKSKIIRIHPRMNIQVGQLLQSNDTLKEFRYFTGIVQPGTRDTLKIEIHSVKTQTNYADGAVHIVTIPGKQYLKLQGSDTVSMCLTKPEIQYLDYQWEKVSGFAEIGEPIILGSLLVILASPFICYDYSAGKMNAAKYKNWAIGSTIGLSAGFATIFTLAAFSKHKRVQFTPDWPNQGRKYWKFR